MINFFKGLKILYLYLLGGEKEKMEEIKKEIIARIIKTIKDSSNITEGERQECLDLLNELTAEITTINSYEIELTEDLKIDNN